MWKQGEHVVIVGMTGCGKTTLANELLKQRKYKIMLVTKPDTVKWTGWKDVDSVDQIRLKDARSFRLWPDPQKNGQTRDQFTAAFDKAWNEGGWTLYVDELLHVEAEGLKNKVRQHFTQGRSKLISVVAGVQRPAYVTLFAFSEATHVFCFRLGIDQDKAKIGEHLGKSFAREVDGLDRYEYLYLNKITGGTQKGNVKTLGRILSR